jgi:hypothetical protein
MTINELLLTEIKAKSDLAKKAIEKYEEFGYSIAFSNIVISDVNLIRAEVKNGEEIVINAGCADMAQIIGFFENLLTVEL